MFSLLRMRALSIRWCFSRGETVKSLEDRWFSNPFCAKLWRMLNPADLVARLSWLSWADVCTTNLGRYAGFVVSSFWHVFLARAWLLMMVLVCNWELAKRTCGQRDFLGTSRLSQIPDSSDCWVSISGSESGASLFAEPKSRDGTATETRNPWTCWATKLG